MNLFKHSQHSIDHLPARTSDDRRKRRLRWNTISSIALTAFIACASTVQATPVAVPNGDFSAAGNVGSVGGGLIGATGTNVPIGSGPWAGTYAGALGLLAPPTLTISATDQDATIGGLLGVSALGVINNSGSFEQALTASVQASMYYTLRTEIDAGRTLELGVLNGTHTGIALKAGGNVVSSTDSAPSDLVNLQLLQGTRYLLTLSYHAPASPPSGVIGISLFARPQGLLTADLLPTIHFDNVSLDVSPTSPVASVGNVTGDGQNAVVDTAFGGPLSLRALDANGNGIAGVPVTFTAPTSGPSATLSGGGQTGTTVTVITDSTGLAAVDPVANTIAGDYEIMAQIEGVAAPTIYHLTNSAGPPAVVQVPDGDGSGTQETPVNEPFALPLSISVTDQFGNPVSGVAVNFVAVPAVNGASADLSAPQATTDDEGLASVDAFANAIAGSYQVNAFVVGIIGTAQFDLTNTTSSPPVSVVAVSGGGIQSTPVGTQFPSPLSVQALDSVGNPVAGAQITFTVTPALNGAAATLSASSVVTGADGTASVTATANTIAGSYFVSANATGAIAGVFALTNTASTPPVSTVEVSAGGTQSTPVGTPFPSPLSVRARDSNGNPVAGAQIAFAVTPAANGAAATLSSMSAVTGADGIASVTATANNVAGSYVVTASATGATSGQFQLTNTPGNTMTPIGNRNQNTVTGSEFACALIVQLADENGQPRAGVNVNFTSPASGPSALLSENGSAGSTSVTTTTDGDGLAFVTATANDIAGSYSVFARESGAPNGPAAEFRLTNLEPNDPVFGDGFDLPCSGSAPRAASPPALKR